MLLASPQLATLRYRLVPARLSEAVFWQDYFGRVYGGVQAHLKGVAAAAAAAAGDERPAQLPASPA